MKLYGVFVGIDLYKDRRISSLRYATADAKALHAALLGNLSADEAKLWLITDQQATRQNIVKAIGERLPRAASEEDLVLIYFSGHGTPEISESIDQVSRYLVTYDTEYENVFATAIGMERELTHLIERIPSKLVAVLLDACFSGKAGGRTFEGPVLATSRAQWRREFKLSDIDLGEGRAILAACDDSEVASEDPSLRHGVFTYFLLKALTDPNAPEPWISLGALYEQVSRNVHAYTMGRQTPVLNGRLRMARLPILRYIEQEG